MPTVETEQWLASRKEIGRTVDPETCEYRWWYRVLLDPYEVLGEAVPEEGRCAGFVLFAQASGGNWVEVHDLPQEVRSALNRRVKREEEDAGPLEDSLPF